MPDSLDLAHLRAVAEAATQGEWTHFSLNGINAVEIRKGAPIVGWQGFDDSDRRPAKHEANALHIATFDPPTVFALLARLETAERERDEAREQVHYATGVADLTMKHRDEAEAALAEARAVIALCAQWPGNGASVHDEILPSAREYLERTK